MSTRSAHSEVINPAIACIYDQALTSIVGTGFTLTEKHVVTCAHVVNAALGRDEANTAPPTEQELIKLSFLNSLHTELRRELMAKVVKWLPKAHSFYDLDDIAILELVDVPKPLALPKLVRLEERDYFSQRAFKAFGFNISEGSWAHGQVDGLIASDTIQLNMECPIEAGFSGAPVWDKTERGVIGMLITIRPRLETAYMIPLSRLLQVFPEADQITIPRNPYRGLALFEEQHAQDFFGREQVTKDLMQKVTQSPFVLLLGISGSGKSSLLNAGLTYQLHQQGYWLVLKVRPLNQPFQDLARSLAVLSGANLTLSELEDEEAKLLVKLHEKPTSLASLCHWVLKTQRKGRLLLIVDQFEELYTHTSHKQTQAKYLDSLLSLLSDVNGKVTLLLALRADFMAQLSTYVPLIQAVNTYSAHQLILSGMSEEELHHAIVKPAQALGVELEQGLAERMLQGLAEDSTGQLPLLEFALTELWNRQRGRRLTHQALDEIGGVAQALAQHAEQVFKNYSAEQQQAIKRIMVKLIVPGAGAEDTRQVARFSDFTVDDQALLPALAGERLIVTGSQLGSEQPTVEVIHEALIREWGRLRGWMDEYREFRIWEERLKQRLADWMKHKNAQEGLLTGRYLLEAQEYLGSHALMLGTEAQDFIRLSAKVEKRQRRTRQGVVAGVVGVISVVAAVAVWQWREATHAAERAQKAELAAKTEAEKAKKTFYSARDLVFSTIQTLSSKDKKVNYDQLDKAFIELTQSEFVDIELLETIFYLFYLDQDTKRAAYLAIYLEKIYKKTMVSEPENTLIINSYAELMIKMGKYKESEGLYQQALQVEPNNLTTLKNYAALLEKQNKADETEKIYQQIIQVEPNNIDNIINYTYLMRKQKNFKKAEDLFKQALNIEPDNISVLSNYASLLEEQSKFEQAENIYKKSLKIDPENSSTLISYASLLEKQNKLEQAEKAYQDLLKVEPDRVDIIIEYEYLLARQNKTTQIDIFYQQKIQKTPNDVALLHSYARFLSKQRKFTQAEGIYIKIIPSKLNEKYYISDNLYVNDYAELLIKQDKFDQAEQLYKKINEIYPSEASILNNHAQLLEKQGKFKQAEELYKKALRIKSDSNNGWIISNYAHLMVKQKKFEKADELYQEATETDPNDAKIIIGFASLMEQQNKINEAKKLYEKAIKTDSNILSVLYASAFQNENTDEDFERLYHQMLQIKPNFPFILSESAMLMEKQKKYDQAEKFHSQAMHIQPQTAFILGNFAKFKLGQGIYTEGQELLDRAFITNNGENITLEIELLFYSIAHFPQNYPKAKNKLIRLLEDTTQRRIIKRDFSPNIERAKQEGNPHAPFLQAVAEVINSRADFDTLKPYLTDHTSTPKP